MRTPAKTPRAASAIFKRLLVVCCLAAPLALSTTAADAGTVAASDNFARANGALGANWTDMAVGGLAIVSQEVEGTNAGGNSGDIRTAETYDGDQYSQVQVTSTPLTGTEWIGPAVRAQAGGQDLYVGIYFWDNGSPELMLFLRDNGNWTQLGTGYAVSPLAAGTTLTLTATGSTLIFAENGSTVISANDTTLTGGAPAIMANGTATASNWAGGDADGTYSVSGTVSGLSGTVLLGDNGSDQLSVIANGAFTFATSARQQSLLQRDGADQPDRPAVLGSQRVGHGGERQRDRRLGHVRDRDHFRYGELRIEWHHGVRQLRPAERQPGPSMDQYDKRRAQHRQPAGAGDQRGR